MTATHTQPIYPKPDTVYKIEFMVGVDGIDVWVDIDPPYGTNQFYLLVKGASAWWVDPDVSRNPTLFYVSPEFKSTLKVFHLLRQ